MDETVEEINHYARDRHAGVVECSYSQTKGRILKACTAFQPGDTIFNEACLRFITTPRAQHPAYRTLVELCRHHDFPLEPLWYWCALNSVILSSAELQPASKKDGETMEAFPITDMLERIDSSVFRQMLMLYHPSDSSVGTEIPILMETFRLGEYGVTPEILESMLQVWTHNCFDASDDPVGFAIYFLPSFSSHSCLPNTVWHLSPDGRTFTLSSRMAILSGDELTLSYLAEDALFQPAFMRQHVLQTTKSFTCDCPRCTGNVDFSRGFPCAKCSNGVLFFPPQRSISFASSTIPSPSFTLKNVATWSPMETNHDLLVSRDSTCHDSHIQKGDAENERLYRLVNTLVQYGTLIVDARVIAQQLKAIEPFHCTLCSYILDDASYQYLSAQESMAVDCLQNRKDCTVDEKGVLTPSNLTKDVPTFLETPFSAFSANNLFKHHWISLRAHTTSTRYLYKHARYHAALDHSRQKLRLIKSILYVPSGCLAWNYEELADLYLRCRWNYSTETSCGFTHFQLDQLHELSDDTTWCTLLLNAWSGQRLLFGKSHPYTIDMNRKIHDIKVILRASCDKHAQDYDALFLLFHRMLSFFSKQPYNQLDFEPLTSWKKQSE